MKRTLLNIQCRLYPFNWNLKNGLHFHSTRIAYRVPNACILMSKYPSHKMIRLSFWKNKWRGIECATEWKASERIVIGYVMNKWCMPHTERDGIGRLNKRVRAQYTRCVHAVYERCLSTHQKYVSGYLIHTRIRFVCQWGMHIIVNSIQMLLSTSCNKHTHKMYYAHLRRSQ